MQNGTETLSSGGDSDAMTPGELAYFNSGGTDTSGLDVGNGSQEPAGGQNGHEPNGAAQATNGADGSQEGQDGAENDGEVDDDEIIITGKDGKPRAHGKDGRFVPHQALHKERERHKMTRQELDTVRERQTRADERLAVLNEILGQAGDGGKGDGTQVDNGPVDPNTDPLGALSQALTKIQALEKQIKDRDEQQSTRDSARAMQSAYLNDAQRYVQEKPEFKDAYGFLISGRHRELEAMGMTNADERNKFIANEERQLVAQAMQSRRSPAQMLHQLAIARGFTPTTQPAAKDQGQQHAEKIERIAQGQKVAGASLTNAGGTSGEGLTAASLADMSEEEFAAVSAKLGKAKMRQLLGG